MEGTQSSSATVSRGRSTKVGWSGTNLGPIAVLKLIVSIEFLRLGLAVLRLENLVD